ncbi:hypothetical protein J6590_054691 [Homalodisca vitripennis]|nr:hypothetical protein J6590_054691 [Homalodisca vitripennis]
MAHATDLTGDVARERGVKNRKVNKPQVAYFLSPTIPSLGEAVQSHIRPSPRPRHPCTGVKQFHHTTISHLQNCTSHVSIK